MCHMRAISLCEQHTMFLLQKEVPYARRIGCEPVTVMASCHSHPNERIWRGPAETYCVVKLLEAEPGSIARSKSSLHCNRQCHTNKIVLAFAANATVWLFWVDTACPAGFVASRVQTHIVLPIHPASLATCNSTATTTNTATLSQRAYL